MARAGAQAASSPLIHGGGWHGNDTLWRTIHDLVDIARNYGVGGVPRPQTRTILTLVDTIVAGEDCGPLKPGPKPCWLGRRSRDWRRIPLLSHLCDVAAREFTDFRGETPTVHAGTWSFAAPVGWSGEIEAARKE